MTKETEKEVKRGGCFGCALATPRFTHTPDGRMRVDCPIHGSNIVEKDECGDRVMDLPREDTGK